ncbi:MAG: DNRLRE domain-containing protein [Candidatus Heimdallarchaeaceae archaeon]
MIKISKVFIVFLLVFCLAIGVSEAGLFDFLFPKEETSEEIIKETVTYTPSSETHCEDELCTLTLYSGTMFADKKGTKIEDVKSLKYDTDWDVWNKVYLEKDPDFDIEILDYNYTSLELNFLFDPSSLSLTELKQKYPECSDSKENDIKCDFKFTRKYEWIDENGTKQKEEEKFQYKYQLKDGALKEDLKYIQKGNPLNYTYTFGGNSTTIMLQDADTENLDDTYTQSTFGTYTFGHLNKLYVGATHRHFSYIKFNISSVPPGQDITDSSLNLYYYGENMETGEGVKVGVHHIYSFPTYNITDMEWTEGDGGGVGTDNEMTHNERPTNGEYNTTYEDTEDCMNSALGWKIWSVTNMVKKSYDDGDWNVSIYLIDEENIGGATTDYAYFYSKEFLTTSLRPYLNITYSEAPPEDTCTPPVSGNWEVDCSDNCSKLDEEIDIDGILRIYGSDPGTFTISNVNLSFDGFQMNATSCSIIMHPPFKWIKKGG